MVSSSYPLHHDTGVVFAQQMENAGFNVDLQIYDWPTLVNRRAEPGLWDMFETTHGAMPDPVLYTFMNDNYPGWWTSPEKEELEARFTGTTDPAERQQIWTDIQGLMYEQVPVVKVGDVFTFDIVSPQVERPAGAADDVLAGVLERPQELTRPPRSRPLASRAGPSPTLWSRHRKRHGHLRPEAAARRDPDAFHRLDPGLHVYPSDPGRPGLGDAGRHGGPPRRSRRCGRELGLDRPIWEQYLLWVGRALQGDLGSSIYFQEPVLRVIGEGAETSAFLALFTMILIIAIGIPAGIVSASYHGTRIDQGLSGLTMLFASIPTFWLGLYLIFTVSASASTCCRPRAFPSVLESGDLSNLRYLILPAITLSAPNSALVIRLVRAGMLDVMREDYVRTARAKGIAEHAVILRHVFRNALIGVVATLGFTFVGPGLRGRGHRDRVRAARHRPAGGAVDPAPRLSGHPGHHPRDHPVLHRGQSGGRHRHDLSRSAGQAAVSAVARVPRPRSASARWRGSGSPSWWWC